MGPEMVSRVGELTVDISQDFGMIFEPFCFNKTSEDLAVGLEMRECGLPLPTD
jgi:hypothetical protein